ncbi:hypothetical protein [Mycolicibacterium sp.]|uniref:hypothetical protein n=1 Tax=Mycolicibacterium sp. TaxID=2320850 RepID=UPI003D1394AD
MCAAAWEVIQPAIERAATIGLTERRAGCIVVLPPAPFRDTRVVDQPDPVFIGLLQRTADPDLYRTHALAKAQVSWLTGLPSREVYHSAPHLYRPGMTKWGGSVVRDGLICAFSGVQPFFDEMIAGWMADTVIAYCRDAAPRQQWPIDPGLVPVSRRQ